ncbi:MAG: LCP family protein [Armatimonadota bacterium]
MATQSREERQVRQKRPARRRARRIFWASFWVLFWLGGLLLGAALGYLSFAGEGSMRRALIAYVRGETRPEVAFPLQDAVTVLVVGADENRDRYKRVISTAARTDTIMLARFDFRNRRVDVISIPRDTLVRIPRHGWGKINAAHVLGGPQLLSETVSTLLGHIKIDHLAIVSYKAFEEAVDAMGGVTIEVEKRMYYHDNWGDLHIDLKPGVQHLNGKQALGYVRFRYTDSDFHRIERQQKFLRAVKERLQKPSVWLRAPYILNAALRNTRTTLAYEQILALALFARELPQERIRMQTLPVRHGRGTDLIVKREEAAQLLREMGFWEDAPISSSYLQPR